MQLAVFDDPCPEGGVVATPAPAGVGVACAATVGGGSGAADPSPNFHVHDAVACVPAGCIKPTLPFTTGVLVPLATALAPGFGRETSTTGNAHSNASAPSFPGICGLPSIVSC